MWYYWVGFVSIGIIAYVIWFMPEIMAKQRAKKQLKETNKVRDCVEKGVEYYEK